MASLTAFFLGGTISMAGTDHGAVARLGAADLLGGLPVPDGVEVDARDFRRMPSASLTMADLLELHAAARECAADGVVVVQGTDTIEETAFVLDLLWDLDAPLVVTGAMRNPTMPGPDGPANLVNALLVASAPAARGLGVLVAFDDEIHAARHVAKRHTISTSAFVSPNTGPLGRLVEDVPVLYTSVPRRPALPAPGAVSQRVALVTATLGDDGVLLDGLAERCDGVVVAGFGAGHVPESWAEPLGELARRIPVVLTSRTGAGPVLTRTYGAVGSETDLRRRGVIGAGVLNPYQARLLLLLLLATGGAAEVDAGFAPYR